MSLLGNLITQVARSAMDPEDSKRNPVNQNINPRRTGGLGDILGGVLGGSANSPNNNQADNGFGLDDVLGGLIGGNGNQRANTNSGAGGLGDILGSVLGGQTNRSGFGGGKGMLVAALLPMVMSWIQRMAAWVGHYQRSPAWVLITKHALG